MHKLVKRERASSYLLGVVISFVLSVLGVRFYLYLMNYPQLGNDVLHIAHVIWGGLLLGIGALLILIFSNSRLYSISSVLIGTGLGLFMDEVGKFLTQTNDYFFRPAAPIIYTFFLMFLFIYIYLRKNKKEDERTLFYHVLDDCKEILDGDLDPLEKEDIQKTLDKILKGRSSLELRRFAQALQAFIVSLDSKPLPPKPWWLLSWFAFKKRLQQLTKIQYLIFVVLLGLLAVRSIGGLLDLLIGVLYVLGFDQLRTALPVELFDQSLIRQSVDKSLFIAQLIAEGIVGLMSVIIIAKRIISKYWSTNLIKATILFSLCTVDILGFYFYQFRQAIQLLIDMGAVTVLAFLESLSPDDLQDMHIDR